MTSFYKPQSRNTSSNNTSRHNSSKLIPFYVHQTITMTFTVQYYTILYYTILYCVMPYHTIPYHTLWHSDQLRSRRAVLLSYVLATLCLSLHTLQRGSGMLKRGALTPSQEPCWFCCRLTSWRKLFPCPTSVEPFCFPRGPASSLACRCD